MDDAPADTGSLGRDEQSADGASRRAYAGAGWLIGGWMVMLAVLFAVFGAAQVGLAAFFVARGHRAFLIPPQQPTEELSITLGGWLPLGACGLVMLAFSWITLRIRRSMRA